VTGRGEASDGQVPRFFRSSSPPSLSWSSTLKPRRRWASRSRRRSCAGESGHRITTTLGVLATLLAVFTAWLAPLRVGALDWWSQRADAEAGEMGQSRAVQAVTSTGRQGAYYLPRGHESRALPLLVFFHGTGGKGSLAILRLQALAEHERFIVARAGLGECLGRMDGKYVDYYNGTRTHLSLAKDAPEPRSVQPPSQGRVVAIPRVGGLHHRCLRRAARGRSDE
jgi:hypothetical protein